MGCTDDVFEALDIQDRLQTLYTSGTVFHTFLGEKLPDWKAAAALVKKIAENYRLPYYTMSPTYSVCADHGYLTGEQYTCPICGRKTEVYSRITGYYRPVQNWNDGKAQEYQDRKIYKPQQTTPAQLLKETADPQKAAAAPDILGETFLFVTKTCPKCRAIKPQLDHAGISYQVMDVEENMEKARALKLNQAPTLVVQNGSHQQIYAGINAIRDYVKHCAL